MKCTKCGIELRETDAFCPNCGEMVQKVKKIENNNDDASKNNYIYERLSSNQQTSYSQRQGENQQYNYNKSNYESNQYEQNNYGKHTIKIGMIVIVFIILLVLIFGYELIIKPIKDDIENTISNDLYDQSSEEDNISNNNSNSDVNKISSYKVKFEGFNFYIPDNLLYEIDNVNNVMNIVNSESTWLAQILITEGNFDSIKKNKDAITSYLYELYGTEVNLSNPTIETIEGVECIVLDATMSGINVTLEIAEVNSMYSAVSVIINQENSFDRDKIEIVNNIINNAEYIGNSTNMQINENNVLDELKKAVNKALEEN